MGKLGIRQRQTPKPAATLSRGPQAAGPRHAQLTGLAARLTARGAPRQGAIPATGIVQRVIDGYKPGKLSVITLAKRGLTTAQQTKVQELHDDPSNTYTTQEARDHAIGQSGNPYHWDVNDIGHHVTTDAGVQDILDHFGHPTQSVVKTYDDLASRVGFDVGPNRKGKLGASTITDLHKHFDASTPLHVGFNPFLNAAWTGNLDSYNGAKKGIPLYSVMRSAITQDFQAQSMGTVTLDQVLKSVSNRPSEIHHILFKAHHPSLAAEPANLMLTERSPREKDYGPGQHELMHMVASGNHKDKFSQLLPQYTHEYNQWVKSKTGSGLY